MTDVPNFEELRLKSPLIHELRSDLIESLCKILDYQDLWMEIAPSMPDISPLDVDGCRKYSGSPSSFLLRIWASKGYCIVDLYNLFAITRLVRCMKIIRSEVHPSFHYLEDFCAQSTLKTKPNTIAQYQIPRSSVLATGRSSVTPSSGRGSSGGGGNGLATTRVGGHHPLYSNTITPNSTQPTSSREDTSMFAGMQNTPAVTYAELLIATSEFAASNIIGRGGYGIVYKGEWKQTEVAVKRLSSSNDRTHTNEKERLRQSLQELNALALFRHDNILPVYAYSLDGPEPCLVYQYMANGSLDDRLQCKKGTPPLSWQQKFTIAKGSAMALHFLHTISRAPLIHGDVKTANILLDRHLEPKLGDFGLSRQGQAEMDVDDKSLLIASHIKGTLAYLPPEFVSSKILSTKLDVYSFGVVLLEISSGLRAYVDSRRPAALIDYSIDGEDKIRSERGIDEDEEHIQSRIFNRYGDRRTIPSTNKDEDQSIFWSLWSMGIKCSKRDRNSRPSCMEIVESFKTISI